ncbi:MAG: M56 family metallopeptidase [Clostridia bacterium]|nr:M56 family metallopeptidase [Clostridia bacterium]
MKDLFLTLLQMSVTAGWLVMAACLFRLIFKKAPKFLRCVLWGMVALRLVLPFSVESVFSVVPKTDTASFFQKSFSPASSAPDLKDALPVIENTFVVNAGGERASSLGHDHLGVISVIWLSGVIVMLIYALLSFILLKRKVADAVKLEKNVFESAVPSPFVLGLLFPKIYIPFGIPENEREFVLRHERAHVQRGDHWYKPIGFILLSVYWFNPLMWLAFILLCRDIELACDEKVIKQYGCEELKAYSGALLSLSVSRRFISACPVAFGETNVKNRIKNVLSYKKPAFWIIIAALAACLAVAVCLLTDPKEKRPEQSSDVSQTEYTSFLDGSLAYDTVDWDIDGDGKKEKCYLGLGPTSGLYSFTFYAEKQNSSVFYLNMFLSEPGTLSFEKSSLGSKLFVRLDRSAYGEDARLYDITVQGGQIVLGDADGELKSFGLSGAEAKAFLNGAYLKQGENGFEDANDPSWGIELSSENVTPTGMKLTLSQNGGDKGKGFYVFGQQYRIDVFLGEEWVSLGDDGTFTTEALMIPSGGSYEWELDWSHIYGALASSYSAGLYRLSKDVSFSKDGEGKYDETKTFYAYFAVPADHSGGIDEGA